MIYKVIVFFNSEVYLDFSGYNYNLINLQPSSSANTVMVNWAIYVGIRPISCNKKFLYR